jgi:hypothetical protein
MIEPWDRKLLRYARQLGRYPLEPMLDEQGVQVGSILPPIEGYTTMSIGVVGDADYVSLRSKIIPRDVHPGLRDPAAQSRLLELGNDYIGQFAGARPYLDRVTGDINTVSDLPADSIGSAERFAQNLRRHNFESEHIIQFFSEHLNETDLLRPH